ncbi:MAG TPA: hypothetical protein VFB66_21665 [Tepidisphaeraceae bacterium]|nr:hypothetical protein [Tepidisphaeraceae bacterium]
MSTPATADHNAPSSPPAKQTIGCVPATFVVVFFLNWLVFFATSVWIGGTALGTTPSKDGFVVEEKGRKTPVSEGVWLFSLAYPAATLTLSPAVMIGVGMWTIWKGRSFAHLSRRARFFIVAFLLFWAAGWYMAVSRDALHSYNDWRRLRSSPPATAPVGTSETPRRPTADSGFSPGGATARFAACDRFFRRSCSSSS